MIRTITKQESFLMSNNELVARPDYEWGVYVYFEGEPLYWLPVIDSGEYRVANDLADGENCLAKCFPSFTEAEIVANYHIKKYSNSKYGILYSGFTYVPKKF